MKKLFTLSSLMLLTLVLSACTPAKAPEVTPTPVPSVNQPTPTPTPEADKPIGPPAVMPAPTAEVRAISIHDLSFDPETVTVRVGTTVTWTNDDPMAHTVTADTAGLFASKQFFTGETFRYTFTKAGTYTYHCAVHPSMKGTIIVQ